MNEYDMFDNQSIDNIFAPDSDTIDGIDIVNIDIDGISTTADTKAKELFEDLTKFYYDEEFLKANPNFRRRVDNDVESLRMLLKMRAADEVTHDVIIKAIAANSSNASLYRSLTQIQTTILQITTKIENIVNNLTTMIKGYQLELNFKLEQEQANMISENEAEPTTIEDSPTTHRGSKSFIEQMARIEEQGIFDGTIETDINKEEENV
jgi:hypothetical protein